MRALFVFLLFAAAAMIAIKGVCKMNVENTEDGCDSRTEEAPVQEKSRTRFNLLLLYFLFAFGITIKIFLDMLGEHQDRRLQRVPPIRVRVNNRHRN